VERRKKRIHDDTTKKKRFLLSLSGGELEAVRRRGEPHFKREILVSLRKGMDNLTERFLLE